MWSVRDDGGSAAKSCSACIGSKLKTCSNNGERLTTMEKDEQELSQISSVGICQIIQISAGLRPGAKKIPV